MSEKKLGEAGRFYGLTPKAHEFVEEFEEFCLSHGIHKKEILKFLVYVVKPDDEHLTFKEAREDLIARGYLQGCSDTTEKRDESEC